MAHRTRLLATAWLLLALSVPGSTAIAEPSHGAHASSAADPVGPVVALPRLQGGWLLDNAFRGALRAPKEPSRSAAAAASTALLSTIVAAPIVNAGLQTLALHGSWRDAIELQLVNAESFALSLSALYLLKTLIRRARPLAADEHLAASCLVHPGDPECSADAGSFPSAQSLLAFTSAGLVCTQQVFLGPRNGWGAGLCVGSMAVAATTAILRIVADRNYATDTLVGAAIGVTAGMLLPFALHFAPWAPLPFARGMQTGSGTDRDQPANPLDAIASRILGGVGGTRRYGLGPPVFDLLPVPWGSYGGIGLAITGRFF